MDKRDIAFVLDAVARFTDNSMAPEQTLVVLQALVVGVIASFALPGKELIVAEKLCARIESGVEDFLRHRDALRAQQNFTTAKESLL